MSWLAPFNYCALGTMVCSKCEDTNERVFLSACGNITVTHEYCRGCEDEDQECSDCLCCGKPSLKGQ